MVPAIVRYVEDSVRAPRRLHHHGPHGAPPHGQLWWSSPGRPSDGEACSEAAASGTRAESGIFSVGRSSPSILSSSPCQTTPTSASASAPIHPRPNGYQRCNRSVVGVRGAVGAGNDSRFWLGLRPKAEGEPGAALVPAVAAAGWVSVPPDWRRRYDEARDRTEAVEARAEGAEAGGARRPLRRRRVAVAVRGGAAEAASGGRGGEGGCAARRRTRWP